MKIEVWSDYVCPFCYIGKRQLEKAIKDSGYEDQLEVEYKSYLLDPTTPVDSEEDYYTVLSTKYGVTVEKAKEMVQGVVERAKEVGLQYNFDQMKVSNTVAAHRLAKWATTKGKGKEINERLLQAYFLEGKSIGKQEELLNIIEELGLDRIEAKEVLNSNQFAEEVETDIYEAQNIGVRGVPFFVFNNKYGISGAQPQQLFEQTIAQAASEAGLKPPLKMVGEDGDACSDGVCDI